TIRLENWQTQLEHGIEIIPSNDFSLYDQVLDTICMLGAIPARYQAISRSFNTDVYFAMARGKQDKDIDIPAMEMTKWFNTNYHHIVPEVEPDTHFSWQYHKILDEFLEAQKAGFQTRPVLVGPLTFLLLSKSSTAEFNPLEKLDEILPIYQEILTSLYEAGAEWVQLDEPILVKDLSAAALSAFKKAYQQLTKTAAHPAIMLTTYFDRLGDNFDLAASLPVEGLHLDLVYGSDQWQLLDSPALQGKTLSLGIINGHNIWRTDLDQVFEQVNTLTDQLNNEIILAPSCSLMHVPQDLKLESKIREPVAHWLAFAVQKLSELSALTSALNSGKNSELFEENRAALQQRRNFITQQKKSFSKASLANNEIGRKNPYAVRKAKQQAHLDLPLFPTTTIGSFPQTSDVRSMRSRFNKHEISQDEYDEFLRSKIKETIAIQNQIGLDVLVHGEFERNDMVQFFGEQLDGFTFTNHGWVQSFGSRYVRPPIIFGEIERPHPMTIAWSSYAQSLTDKPIKGMLTGPITILQWSFVRDDQPRSETCLQIAQAIRTEVLDLEAAGIRIIQIDEPALREGLPLKKQDWQIYLDWAVRSFQVAAGGVKDETQIHTHMCYSEFNEIIASIAALDADVISIEAARSGMELLNAFSDFEYPNEIGPGVYDIHSPRIPTVEEMVALLEKAVQVIPADQLWVNPDCGLKTRNWQETIPSLENMVSAAELMRKKFES
ncbi:MAG: 5-methyltetrahydropteroyltriglutamate--homocysteine S-methyltransferase, partial [Chloroflexi bacterium]|nr:5-methyltetrahydropteroyltriglutamate--homocysteine S-methyltransferase [Chloroflexota bacterium]